ncbi:MAG TPA: DUF3618 domain-containing protein [Acidimicrobiia bacterium]|nr:DUF3618 domain-containing protein [Acidimicrobiia bacterium]
MSTTNRSETGEAPATDPEEIRAEIEATRDELGETVEALAAKADIKARVMEKKQEVAEKIGEVRQSLTSATPEAGRDTFSSAAGRVRSNPMPAIFLAGVVLGWLVGRRK